MDRRQALQMSIDEALDAREAAYRRLIADKPKTIEMFTNHALAMGMDPAEAREDGTHWYAISRQSMAEAETFLWCDHTAGEVLGAAAKLPADVPFSQAWLPTAAGWWWLGRQSPWIVDYDDPELPSGVPTQRRICALVYRVDGGSRFVLIEAYTFDLLPGASPTRGPALFAASGWREGESLRQFLDRATQLPMGARKQDWWARAVGQIGRLLMSACLWMQQRVVSVRQEHGTRGIRRRLDKLGVSSTTKIVTLRRYEQEVHEGPTNHFGTPLAWRVPVIGHWRNQPYPSKACIIPIWIDPHWRGPEDAPVRAPSKVIYRVTR